MQMRIVTCVAVLSASLLTGYRCANRLSAQEVPVKRNPVAQLVSRNKAPELPDVRAKPEFDAQFDPSEQKRVWKAVGELFKSADKNWDSITANINNDAYCVTVRTFNGSKYNWTVGDVCRKVTSVNLTAAYFQSLEPQTRELYVNFREPDFARNAKALKEWLEARPGKSLAELQADACDWALNRLAQRQERDDWSDKDRDRWTAAIRKTAETLRADGVAIQSKGFGHEEFQLYFDDSGTK